MWDTLKRNFPWILLSLTNGVPLLGFISYILGGKAVPEGEREETDGFLVLILRNSCINCPDPSLKDLTDDPTV